jgi:predicted nucleic acid-binding protein
VRLFADTSVLLAAAGSVTGSSHALFALAPAQGWTLISSPYAVGETERNLPKLPPIAATRWADLRLQLTIVPDIVSLDRPAVFLAGKDRPILFTALAEADVLLTLDKADFTGLLGSTFYGLPVMLPYNFLQRERDAGRLPVVP